ncbi:hypothetical protein Ae717Ps2_3580c [Pseudonocardia sp. Ae717_Ps2]|nr:hypothetical protein Ae717Ps2_3580c [Pseudonocardia sp. Ae717_Ps2]
MIIHQSARPLIDADREPFEMTRFVMRADSAALD